MSSKVKLTVRGQLYETFETTLNRYPETLLGSCERRHKFTNPLTNVIEVDCSYVAFDSILFYYQSEGMLYKPPDIGMEEFVITCQMFEISEEVIRDLCMREKYFLANHSNSEEEESAPPPTTVREKFWKFLEEPSSSKPAQVYGLISIALIAVATILQLAVTEPGISQYRTNILKTDPWSQTELGMNSFFLLEYLLKLITCPNIRSFIFDFQNVIDALAVFPYFITLGIEMGSFPNLVFLRALRTIRVLRVLRFSKQNETLSSVVEYLKSCVEEFLVLILCLFVNCCLYGAVEYYIEQQEPNTQFTSIPEAMWWALQTVTTIGYGDITPISLWGKLFAMSVAIFGALTLSIPLLTLGSKYTSMTSQAFNVSNAKLERMPRIVRFHIDSDAGSTSYESLSWQEMFCHARSNGVKT